jgi:two-component system, chemotaxis family, chemotaxis protein CheY
MNILIADDSKMIRHMAITALNELGYDNITEASDVSEAKNLLKGKKYDLIISDWHMPGETGLDFLKYIKSNPEYANIPFILQTTENEKKNIVEAVKAGVQGYLFKPVQKAALSQKMLELSGIYKFQPPSVNIPARELKETAKTTTLKNGPDASLQTGDGISAKSLADFILAPAKQDYGFSFGIKSGNITPLLVCLGNDNYRQFPKTFLDRFPDSKYILICDSQTENKLKDVIDNIIKESDGFKIVIPEITKNRSILQYGAIIDTLSAKGFDSSSIIIAFGDMPIQSIAGFIAATYRGGIKFASVPLSLRSFLDSSVESTWILDNVQSERIAGLRYDPSMIWFDVNSLVNVPDFNEYAYSCAEFFRYAFIGGKELTDTIAGKWETLLKKDFGTIAEFSRLCVAARASIRALNIDNASKQACLQFAQSLTEAIMDCSAGIALNPGQALYRSITCIFEAAKQSKTIVPQSFEVYGRLLQKMPPFQMPEALNYNKVFQKAFGPQSRDFGRTLIAMPYMAGSVNTVKDVSEEIFHEVLKNFLSPQPEPDETKK